MERELACLGREDGGAEDVRGHHVGDSLNAAEIECKEAGECLDGEGLGYARDTFDKGVSAAKEGEECLVDELLLAGDDAADLGAALGEKLIG